MEAWFIDDSDEDQRLPHHLNPPHFVSYQDLAGLGLSHWVLNADEYETDPILEGIRKDKGYAYKDIVTIQGVQDAEEKLKNFYQEHLHNDDEIRYFLEGSGYFDVRNKDDRWIRIVVKKGDLLILPAGCYHRFTLDQNNYVKAMRLFIEDPVWTPINKPEEYNPIRQQYVCQFLKK